MKYSMTLLHHTTSKTPKNQNGPLSAFNFFLFFLKPTKSSCLHHFPSLIQCTAYLTDKCNYKFSFPCINSGQRKCGLKWTDAGAGCS